MTSQALITKTPVNTSASATVVRSAQESSRVDAFDRQSRVLEAMKSQYPVDQQLKFLHLQAEAESLLQQLQVLQKQRQTTSDLGSRIDDRTTYS
jgi:hypothetical protein